MAIKLDSAAFASSAVKQRLPSLAFIGAGKVGTALSTCLAELGYPVVAVSSRAIEHAETLAGALPDCRAVVTPAEVAAGAEVVFLTVPDSAVASVAREVAWRQGMAAVHCSGALGLAPLDVAGQAGALTGCLHPLYPCADVSAARRGLRRCSYGIVAGGQLEPVLARMAAGLSGRWFSVPDETVPLYHAAACLASNFSVALVSLAVDLWRRCGIEPEQAVAAMGFLMEGTVSNLARRGLPGALTGPMVRGDAATVALHLAALDAAAPELLPLYRELGQHTLALAARDGLAEEKRREIEEMLTGSGYTTTQEAQ